MLQEHVEQAVDNIAAQLTARPTMFPDIVVPIMTGALFFSADLLREIYPTIDPIVWPVKATRLPKLTEKGKFTIAFDRTAHHVPGGIHNKRVLLVDTVFDTGATILALKRFFEEKQVRSVQSAVLIWKNLAGMATKPDYYGVDLKGNDAFLHGYGMDKDNSHRGSRAIYW